MKNAVKHYQIVYPLGSENLEYFAYLVQRKAKTFDVVSDESEMTEYEIVVGNTNRADALSFEKENEYSVITKGSKVYINASNDRALYYAVNYFIEYAIDENGNVSVDFNVNGTLENYFSENWGLDLPCIEDGVIAPAYNTGTGMADDREADTIIDSYMHLVSEVEFTAFEKYAKKLESFGFKKIYSSKLDQNDLWCYRLGKAYAYINYIVPQKYITVVCDKSSNCEVSDIDTPTEQTGKTVFYQYSIDYEIARLKVNEVHDWGIFYIVKFPDNSLVLVDGGSPLRDGENKDRCLQGLCDFLYKITQTKEDAPLRIRLWYFTHSDSDHTGKSYDFLQYLERKGYKMPIINALAFNFPSTRGNITNRKDPPSFEMIRYMNEKYPNINYMKLHTGMVLNIGELKIEVLATVESCVEPRGTIPDTYNTNDTCSLVRFNIGKKSVLMCGDIGKSQQQYIDLYSDGFLKSDVLQAAHHGINYLPALYEQCDPEYVLVPNSVELMVMKWKRHYDSYNALVEPGKIHYAGDYTTAMEIEDGKVTIERIPRYDNLTGELD